MYINTPVVPDNKEGKSLDLQFTITEKNIDEAKAAFTDACDRLLQPELWHELSGALTANFEVTNARGVKVQRKVREQDFLKITLPAPGAETGDGHDWVMIEKIAADIDLAADESLAVTVRAAKNPGTESDDTAHFFKDTATSTFIISRKNKTITAFYFGRNEIPNTNVPGILNKMRNGIVAAGAMAGLSNLQWSALLKNLLQPQIPEN